MSNTLDALIYQVQYTGPLKRVRVKRRGKSKSEEGFQKALGRRIEAEIRKKGFESPYDFWIQKAGDHLSRAALNYILNGRTDVKITTLRTIAGLLEVKTQDLLDFE